MYIASQHFAVDFSIHCVNFRNTDNSLSLKKFYSENSFPWILVGSGPSTISIMKL